MTRFRELSIAQLFAAGCIVLVCCLLGLAGLAFAGNLYFRSRRVLSSSVSPTSPAAIFTVQPSIEQPAPIAPSEQVGAIGKIVYVCQIFTLQSRDQICIMNADGSGQRRLTTNDNARHFYPSLSPDGLSVLFSSDLNGNFEIYELVLATNQLTRLGAAVGIAPEISPDNHYLALTRSYGGGIDAIWALDRYGINPHQVHSPGWDPTWSPDGRRILFATKVNDKAQLAVSNLDGSGFQILTDLPALRGRSDWSADGLHIITYSGRPWNRELFIMNADGSDLHQVSPPGGNSQGPSFSPDGQWVAFTAYFNHYRDLNGCEIYIMRIDGSNLTRLTDNNYCDWQPRWGP
jgi:Tol biopolymer transport system component